MSREGRRRWGVLQSFMIGKQDNPMMKRIRLIQTPLFGIYLHLIYREDLDAVPHDHPWTFWRCVLRGSYVERFYADPETFEAQRRIISSWWPSKFVTTQAHRITYVEPGTVSLVFVGRKVRIWGFWEPRITGPYGGEYVPGGDLGMKYVWVDYRDALRLRPTEGVSG